MAEATPYGRVTQRPSPIPEIHILWMTSGLRLRRRLSLHHRSHPAEHRRRGHVGHPRPAEGSRA